MSYYLNGKLHYYGYYNGQKITIAVPRTALEQLTTPTISLDGSTLTMTATDDRTQEFVIFVDGVEMATVETPKEETYTVSGTWVFNETLSGIDLQQKVSFNCNGKKYEGITTQAAEDMKPNIDVTYWGTWNADDYVNAYGLRLGVGYAWSRTEYRYIVFYGTQYVSKEFYDWLVANATYGEGN